MPLRLILSLTALIVGAWFAVGWVQARDTGRAQSLLASPRLSPGQAGEADSLLRSAGTLNPDRTVEELRSKLASREHHHRSAVALAESVVRAEPLNALAWKQLIEAAAGAGRSRLAETAYSRLAQLVAEPK